jgi:hypothetical protein
MTETIPETWQEEWRFLLHQEDGVKEKIRSHVQFGGRLSVREHFLPRAQEAVKLTNALLVKIDGFKSEVDLNKDLYIVSAFVTLKRNS